MSFIDSTVNDSIATTPQSVVLDVRRHAAATVTLTGTWVGTIQFEATTDNVTWVSVLGAPVPSGSSVTSTTANGTWLLNVAAFASMRLRSSAWSSGTAAIAVRASISTSTGTLPTLTPASIPFANASGALTQNNANFSWNDAVSGLGIGRNNAQHSLHINRADNTRGAVHVDQVSTATNGSPPIWLSHTILSPTGTVGQNLASGIRHTATYGAQGGSPVASIGSLDNFVSQIVVLNTGAASSEHSLYTGWLSYQNNDAAFGNTTPGSAWGMDLNMHSAITTQQTGFTGVSMFQANHFNGSPSGALAGAFTALTEFNNGGGASASQLAAQTYPLDYGFGVAGTSGVAKPGATAGWTVGFLAGSHPDATSTPVGNWGVTTHNIKYGHSARDVNLAGYWADAPKSNVASAFVVNAGAWKRGVDFGTATFTDAPIVLPNAMNIAAKDTAGTVIGLMNLAADNTARFGTMASPTTNGNTELYVNGVLACNFIPSAHPTAVLQGVLAWVADNTYDIGVTGANRPRDLYLGRGAGFFGTAAVTAKPTVTGSKGANAALTSLMTALAAYGLVTDSTT